MFVIPRQSPPARRWLAHLVRASAGAIRPGDLFDDVLPFDTAEAVSLARRHRVGPLIHRGLADGRIADSLPDAFARACRELYFATLRKNIVALETAGPVLSHLAAAGIASAPLKGWALLTGAEPVYADAGMRPMDDLDLIVPRAEVDRATRIIEAHDFRAIAPRGPRLAAGHEIAFHRQVAGVDLFVELHFAWAGSESLMRQYAMGGETFLEAFCSDCGPGEPRQPTRIGHLLFVAVHAARHAFRRWLWLLDLHRIVDGVAGEPALDWSEVVRTASEHRLRRPLYAGLAAARELLRTPVPKEVLAELAPGPVRRRLLHSSLRPSAAPSEAQRRDRVAKLLLGESWWDVARTAAWASNPGRSWYEKRGERSDLAQRIANPVRMLRGAPRPNLEPRK